MKKCYLLGVALFCFFRGFSQNAIVLYVDSSHTGFGIYDGSSWNNAYKELRDALSYKKTHPAEYQIRIAKGTYKTTIVAGQDTAFVLAQDGARLLGGYPPKGIGIRDPQAYPTILSGDGVGHIVVALHMPADDLVVIDGLTFTNGNTGDEIVLFDGEAVARGEGGAVWMDATVKRGTVSNCLFRSNQSDRGAAIFISGATVTVSNCSFVDNSASYGAGVYVRSTAFPDAKILNCNFTDNFAGVHGGAICNESASPQISNCLFRDNIGSEGLQGGGGGGAIYNYLANPKIVNSLFYKNKALRGGAVFNERSKPEFVNCTMVLNTASLAAGAINNEDASIPVLRNSILWKNYDSSNVAFYNSANSSNTIVYSLVEGGYSGTGNLNADPKFININNLNGADNIFGTADDGLALTDLSPAINKGNNASLPSGTTTDITGATRIQGNVVDMGAYESSYLGGKVLYVDSSIAVSGSGYSWANAYKEVRDAISKAATDNSIDSIMVAKGTYYPTNNTNRDSAFTITRGKLKIYGGFPGGGGVRNLSVNSTILSGDIGTLNNSADNSYHIFVLAGIIASGDSVVLDGLSFTKGNANSTGSKIFNGQTINRNEGAGVALSGIFNKTVFRNCVFNMNVSALYGGAILNTSASPSFINCVIAGNKAEYGGGIFNYMASPSFINCTMAKDTATNLGGAIFSNTSTVTFTNSIAWANFDTDNNIGFGSNTATYNVSNSIVPAGISGTNNINQDPQFVNITAGNFQLQACTPATNAGSATAFPTGISTDLNGSTRIFNGFIDIGAYENLQLPTLFTFKGFGNWTMPGNWHCNWVPPAALSSGNEIIIDPVGGDCLLNIPYTLTSGSKLTVKAGKKLIVQKP